MLKEISKARSKYRETTGDTPRDFALSYEDGLCMLIEYSKAPGAVKRTEIQELLDEGDRTKIKEYLNKMTVYGMKLTVVDILVEGGKS